MKEMKTLTLNGVKYEIVDAKSRSWIGDLSKLESNAPDLVSAINEALQNSGGTGVNAEEVKRIVEEYLEAHPPAPGEPGEPGKPGQDGVSPVVTVEAIDGGHRITITDVNGPQTFDVMDGASGTGTAEPGKDGVSPTIDITPIEGGNRITITDVTGTHSFDVLNGKDGNPGTDGDDGFSPSVSVESIDGGYRITITDADGPKTVEVLHGKDGEPGKDGYTPVKGEDYFTPEDVQEIAQEASNLVTIDQVTPDQVVFPDGLQTTYAIGKVKLVNGSAELVPVGGTLEDFFNVFVDEKNPAITQPSVQITFNQAKAYEVGTVVTPAYSAKLSPGSYSYGPATGVTATAWEITDTEENTASVASGTFPALTVGDNTSYKITAKASYGAGSMPKTNTGNDYPAGQIKAGSKSATSSAVTGYRNSFYGTLPEKSDLTSGIIRGLAGTSGKALSNGSTFDVPVPVGAIRVVIAYPATLRDISSVKDVNGMSAEISSSFTPQTVQVEGANGFNAIDYKVYTLDFANANDTANTFTVTI